MLSGINHIVEYPTGQVTDLSLQTDIELFYYKHQFLIFSDVDFNSMSG